METDGHPVVVEEEAALMQDIAREHGAMSVEVAKDEDHAVKLASARRSAFAALARIRPTTILEDVTVPRSELPKMVRFVNEVAEKYELEIATFGHMGDGNLHPTFLTNERDEEEMKKVEQAMRDIFLKALELNGTITGEHGVGLAKKSFLSAQFQDASYEMLKKVKLALDPDKILNPGKIFDTD